MAFIKNRMNRFVDKIYDRIASLDGSDGIDASELYVGILLLFNDINKYSPGKWVNPPTREEVYKMLETFDTNKDGTLSREEFKAFCKMYLPEVTKKVMRDLIISFVVTPLIILFIVTHLSFVKKILPEAALGAVFVAILSALGVFNLLDDLMDRVLPTKVKPYEHKEPPAAAPTSAQPSTKQD